MSNKSPHSGCLAWIIFAALIVGGVAYVYTENEKNKAQVAAAREAEHKQLLQTIVDTADKFNADIACNEALVVKNDDAVFNNKIMTVDVQKCWLQNRPIVFRGELTDVALLDNNHYTIFIKSSAISNRKELELVLKCKKDVVDVFRNQTKNAQAKKRDWEKDFDEGVAVIASIVKITTSAMNDDKNKTDARIGYGDCLALVPDEGAFERLMRSLRRK